MSNLSFTNTKVLRDNLLKRNLDSTYAISDVLPIDFTDSTYPIQGTSDYSVVDQQDVSGPATSALDNAQVANKFAPEQYIPTSIQTVILGLGTTLNYLESFTPTESRGSLGLISILTGDDKGQGDTEMVQIARNQLKNMTLATMGVKLNESTLGRINAIDALKDPEALDGLLTGREKVIERDYQITVPGNPITRAAEYFSRISGTQLPVSYIPGNFFEGNVEKGKVEGFLDKAGQAVGQALNLDFTSHKKTYSQKLLQYTSGGQKSRLFKSVNYNKYQPAFDTSVGGVVNNAIGFVQGLAGLDPTDGLFYLGSGDVDPGVINTLETSSNSEKGYIVSGPSKMVKMFEGDVPLNTFPENDRTYLNGTSKYNTETQFIWLGDDDTVRGTIDGVSVQSNEKTIKPDTLLGKTQQIVQDASSLSGEARLKHPGHVISNVAYKYHDGYKLISKGNAVRGEDDDFCRVWTKDYGYDRHGRMVRYKGIQDTQRRVPGSVIRSQTMLNIAPTRDKNGKPINFGLDESGNNISKYMFSIENLAWAGSDKLRDRPICEQGPNDGRIMWFPPYDLKYSDDNRANWTSHTFLGRPEPIYTYNNAERTGVLSFKVVVDHPSIFNLLRKKLEKSVTDEGKRQEIMDSFIAGCKDFDIYELATEFASLSMNEVQTLEEYLNANSSGTLKADRENSRIEVIRKPSPKPIPIISPFEEKYPSKNRNTEIQLYWYNDIPGPQNSQDLLPNSTFESDLESYIERFEGSYQSSVTGYTNAPNDIKWGDGELDKFKNILTGIKDKIEDIKDSVQKTLELNDNFKFEIVIKATTSAVATNEYNNALASRRGESLKKYLLGDKFSEDRIKVTLDTIGENTNPEFAGFDCNKLQDRIEGTKDTRIFSKSATYCRTAKATIKLLGEPTRVEIDPGEDRTVKDYILDEQDFVNDNGGDTLSLLLKSMHSECDYFYELEKEHPMVFSDLVDKLKYFQPGFHSTTPEGLNKRLTFLQQCLRPGETIKVYDEQNNEITDISSNTSFGRPPVCVLRIGDFFHTKMVVDNVNITYDDTLWDMNPEGIGMQPMIASVNMGVKFIGGHGISNVINELQNALSFNYYANTEVYDEMATTTKGGRDKEHMKKVISALDDKRTADYAKVLNNENESPDNDDYWGNLSEKDPELITYNQFYNDFTEKVNDYVCQVRTEIGNLTDKYGEVAVSSLFGNKERYNIKSTIRTSTTDSVDIKFVGNTFHDYNEDYSEVLKNVRNHIENGNLLLNPTYDELKKKINFNTKKIEDFVNITNFILDEVENNFKDYGTDINKSLDNIHQKHKELQKVMDAMDIILGDEIDGYYNNDGVWVVKYLNNLTSNNGNMGNDVDIVLTTLNDFIKEVSTLPTPEIFGLESAKESEALSVRYFYEEILPFYLKGNTFDLDAAIGNNRVFVDSRQVRKGFERYIQKIKQTPIIDTYSIDDVVWNDIIPTQLIYDYRLTDTTNPANQEILKDYYDKNAHPRITKNEDSKFCWKRLEPITGIQPKGISPFNVEIPKPDIIPLDLLNN